MRTAIRLLAVVAAVFVLPGGSGCEDNLGDVDSGPVSFRVSIDTQTQESDGASSSPSVSADGRYVAFASRATNLAPSEAGFQEIFVRDRLSDTAENVSLLANVFDTTERADCLQPAISADGRFVVFRTTCPMGVLNGLQTTTNLFRFDRETDTLEVVVSAVWPDSDCLNPSISEDGNRVAFETAATNLPGFAGGGVQVYVAEFPGMGAAPILTLISHATGAPATAGNNAAEQCQISADGQFVVYQSRATNLTADVTGARRMVWLSAADGSSTELISRETGAAGAVLDNHCGLASVSRDGRYVSFLYQGGSFAPGNLPELKFPLVRRDRGALPAPVTELAASDCFGFAIFVPIVGGPPTRISDDGRFIAYLSTNSPVTDLFVRVRDLQGGTFNPSISLIPAGGGTLNDFPTCTLSGDGRWVFWTSEFEGQVPGDTNAAPDVFGFGPMR
jgi:hypothetical protein